MAVDMMSGINPADMLGDMDPVAMADEQTESLRGYYKTITGARESVSEYEQYAK